ncbi:MAG: hypothetical protein A2Z83_06745 [Omnitrophica bacterium GWA2_52_8]|nr:MAG: hypothetical protein A2Z83_06745 [Omnitrophica bacterium GWA2_52_8]
MQSLNTDEKSQKTIKSWPKSERPRERLLLMGAAALSDSELLAILLRHGQKGTDVISEARMLLSKSGGLRNLLSSDGVRLRHYFRLGPVKSATLLAATEITRRQLREEMLGKNYVRDPASVLNYLYYSLRDKKKEVFKVLFLNKQNCILDEKDLFLGTIDEAAVHPREIVKAVLDFHATAVVLVHNHPSGRAVPSLEDKQITRKIIKACQSVSVAVLDHLIIGNNEYYSFREHGLLDESA